MRKIYIPIFIFIALLCFGVQYVSASDEVFASIRIASTTSETVYFENPNAFPSLGSSVTYDWYTYKGVYPDTSSLKSSGSGGSVTWDLSKLNISVSPIEDGDYYKRFVFSGGLGDFYISANRLSGVWDFALENTTTRFTSFSYSTSTSMVNIQGYWNATTTPYITETLEFYQYSTMMGSEALSTLTATSSGYFDVNLPYRPLPTPYSGATTTITITAPLELYANLYQIDGNYYNPFGEQDYRYSTLLDATSTVLIASTTDLWNIGTTTRGIFLYPEYICDITSITGCFKNALIWAFYPTQQTIEDFYNLQTLIQSKAPFGYFSVVKKSINSLSATSTPSFSIIIPNSLKIYIFNPFDIAISSILWLFFLFNFYKRLKYITI